MLTAAAWLKSLNKLRREETSMCMACSYGVWKHGRKGKEEETNIYNKLCSSMYIIILHFQRLSHVYKQ